MKQIKRFVRTYVILLALFLLQKPVFMLVTHGASGLPWGDLFSSMPAVMWHGLPLDLATAGYLSLLPGIILLASIWIREEYARLALNVYMGIASLAMALCFVLNMALYPYWNFPLDTTPFFYFFTSPSDALASVSWWVSTFGFIMMFVVSFVFWLALRAKRPRRDRYGRRQYSNSWFDRHRPGASLVMLVLTALLIIPIRGGFSVSTTNTGKAYYSQVPYLNHAAVNPMFSLIESINVQKDFASLYRFMDEREANKIFSTMVSSSDENTYPILRAQARNSAPDILIVVMEGFASDLMPSMGTHKDVAVCLDSIAQQGILFTRFYANSFRTDRGLVSILSGYPAQPTMSIMKNVAKSAHLPSLVKSLCRYKHYGTAYYYGGDVNFTNLHSYLISQGFERIVCDQDFPMDERLSKWGVHDHIVADRMMSDIEHDHSHRPMIRVLQTSSSHEPFDVPYARLKDKRLNAFAYTDSVIGSVVRRYSRLPRWKNTLVILVPDHVGGYKEHLDDHDRSRYQIPLILTGGAIARPMKINLIGSQQDIAATLLGQFGIPHKDFLFSKNMLSDKTPKFAFFTVNDAFGVVSEENSLIYDNKMQKVVYDKGPKPGYNLKRGEAYLQKLYDDIGKK